MGVKFFIQGFAYKLHIRSYISSINDINLSMEGVEEMSSSSGIIVRQYLDRLEQIHDLIKLYGELAKKDGDELSVIVDELMNQEDDWARIISGSSGSPNGKTELFGREVISRTPPGLQPIGPGPAIRSFSIEDFGRMISAAAGNLASNVSKAAALGDGVIVRRSSGGGGHGSYGESSGGGFR